jgi:hypothetical protein
MAGRVSALFLYVVWVYAVVALPLMLVGGVIGYVP